MFREVLGVLRDGAAVEVGDAEVEQYIKEVGEVEEGLVGAVGGVAEQVLHLAVDAENPEWLHQQVEKQQEDDIFDETVLHGYSSSDKSFLKSSMSGKALRRFSGKSSLVLYVATPIGLLYSLITYSTYALLADLQRTIPIDGFS